MIRHMRGKYYLIQLVSLGLASCIVALTAGVAHASDPADPNSAFLHLSKPPGFAYFAAFSNEVEAANLPRAERIRHVTALREALEKIEALPMHLDDASHPLRLPPSSRQTVVANFLLTIGDRASSERALLPEGRPVTLEDTEAVIILQTAVDEHQITQTPLFIFCLDRAPAGDEMLAAWYFSHLVARFYAQLGFCLRNEPFLLDHELSPHHQAIYQLQMLLETERAVQYLLDNLDLPRPPGSNILLEQQLNRVWRVRTETARRQLRKHEIENFGRVIPRGTPLPRSSVEFLLSLPDELTDRVLDHVEKYEATVRRDAGELLPDGIFGSDLRYDRWRHFRKGLVMRFDSSEEWVTLLVGKLKNLDRASRERCWVIARRMDEMHGWVLVQDFVSGETTLQITFFADRIFVEEKEKGQFVWRENAAERWTRAHARAMGGVVQAFVEAEQFTYEPLVNAAQLGILDVNGLQSSVEVLSKYAFVDGAESMAHAVAEEKNKLTQSRCLQELLKRAPNQ